MRPLLSPLALGLGLASPLAAQAFPEPGPFGLPAPEALRAWIHEDQRAALASWAALSSPVLLEALPAPASRGPRARAGRGVPGAVVEVVGTVPNDPRGQMRELSLAYRPAFRQAFEVGLGSGVAQQMLSQFMADPLTPPTASPVWYNCTIPDWVKNPPAWMKATGMGFASTGSMAPPPPVLAGTAPPPPPGRRR